MSKVVSFLLAISFLWWLGYIFIVSDPNVRIERTCDPISAVFGRLAGSVSDLAQYEGADDVREWFSGATYSCRYMVWNQFFGDEWRARAKDRPVSQQSKEERPAPVVRMGIDGKPLPPLPGEPHLIAHTPLPGEPPKVEAVPKVEPLPPGTVPPPMKVEPVVRSPRDVPPPAGPVKRKSDSLDDIQLPEKRPN